MTQMPTSIYDPQYSQELRAYTIKLLNLLEEQKLITGDKMKKFQRSFITQSGDVAFKGTKDTRKSDYKQLEYIVWNETEYYYCPVENSLYTYSSNPKRIGAFDIDSMTAVII